MKARYIGAQQVSSQAGNFLKVFFSAQRDSLTSNFTNDDGVKMDLAYKGEKVFDMKCTPEAFAAFDSCDPGKIVDFDIEPNPSNPRTNIIVGIKAAAAPRPQQPQQPQRPAQG